MKKPIISLLLILSFSFQSTYPLFEGIKSKFSVASERIKKAKELLNMKANIRCLRVGDNCSKEKRAMLGVISGLVAALAAAGIVVAGKAIAGRGEKDQLSKEESLYYGIQKARTWGLVQAAWRIVKQSEINLNDIKVDGLSLVGALIKNANLSNNMLNYDKKHVDLVQSILKSGVIPTELDIAMVRGLFDGNVKGAEELVKILKTR